MINLKSHAVPELNDAEYQQAQTALVRRSYPDSLLRLLMQALENYRGSRKIGWSRPWNKVGVCNFQSFKLRADDDELSRLAREVLKGECPDIPSAARSFLEELLYRENPAMGFVFLTEVDEGAQRFEGAVLSYGRVNSDNRRFRDRFDILLESKVVAGRSVGLSRIRIFVDPYRPDFKEPVWAITIDSPGASASFTLFEYLVKRSLEWAEDPSRLWKHWVTEYIDYFGPRNWSLESSCFPQGQVRHAASLPSPRFLRHRQEQPPIRLG